MPGHYRFYARFYGDLSRWTGQEDDPNVSFRMHHWSLPERYLQHQSDVGGPKYLGKMRYVSCQCMLGRTGQPSISFSETIDISKIQRDQLRSFASKSLDIGSYSDLPCILAFTNILSKTLNDIQCTDVYPSTSGICKVRKTDWNVSRTRRVTALFFTHQSKGNKIVFRALASGDYNRKPQQN